MNTDALHALVASQPLPVRKHFWVEGETAVWVVADGAIDLFLQRRGPQGEPQGPRHHVRRVSAGQAFFGAGTTDLPGGSCLIAVPLPGSTLHELDTATLQAASPAAQVPKLCDDWVSFTTRAMQIPAAPRQAQPIEADSIEAEAEQILHGNERVVWIDVRKGNALWMESYEYVVNQASGPLPLHRDLWLKAAGPLKARCVDAGHLLGDGRMWNAIGLYQRFLLNWIIGDTEVAVEREQARLESKAEQSLILRREALQKLLSVADDKAADNTRARHSTCLEACKAIAAQAGMDFRMPHAADRAAMDRDPVAAIAAASRVRYRRVALKGDWWKADNGPLVASFEDGGAWVALLPKYGGYDLYDPSSGKTLSVDESVAVRLNPFASMFYAVLPDHSLRFKDIGAFVLRGRGGDLALVLALGALGGLLGIATPIATGSLVDTLIPSADVSAIWQMVAALAAVAVATAMFQITRSVAVLRIEGKMDSGLQAALWDRVLKLPVPFFRDYAAGDLAQRINGVNTIRRMLSGTAISAILGGVFSIFNFFLLFYYSSSLAVIAALLVVGALAVTLVIGYIKLRYERQLSAAAGKLSSLVFQYLNGIAKLRVGASEGRAFANWAEQFSHYRGLQFNAQHWGNVQHTVLTGYSPLATAVLFAAVGLWLGRESGAGLSTGDFIAFSAAFGAFFSGIVGLAETLLDVLNLVPIYERAKPILETLPETDESCAHPGELQGGLEVTNLRFSYGDGPEILKGVSFSVRAGGFIALVGPSGSGKSTLLRLLLGFEKPASGGIYYDNQDLTTIDLQALRRQLGVVLQNGQLIPGEIYTNIVGASSLTIDDAWEAARMVGLDDDINQMPMGMHTVIGEGASTLSGGQRQRILIARSIVHRPRVLYFDEATSALDNRTQAIVTRSLDQLKATRIVIAHRLSTIMNADRIIVLKDGEVVQTGNYESLIAEPGVFADLARRQVS